MQSPPRQARVMEPSIDVTADSGSAGHMELADVVCDRVSLEEAELLNTVDTDASLPGFDAGVVRRQILSSVPNVPSWRNTAIRLLGMTALAIVGAALMAVGHALAYVPGVVIFSAVLAGMIAIQHECSHRGLFRRRWVNDAVGSAAGFLSFLPYAGYHIFHLQHHVHVHDEKDSEVHVVLRSVPAWMGYILGSTHGLRVVSIKWWAVAMRSRSRYTVRLAMVTAVLTVLSVVALVWFAVVAPMVFVLWWVVPTLISSSIMGVSYLADHYGCAYAPDLVTRTGRSVRSNAVIQYLTWNINFHAVHHLAPGVPTQHRPAAHALFEPYLEHYERSYWSFHRSVLSDIRHRRFVADPPWVIDLRD